MINFYSIRLIIIILIGSVFFLINKYLIKQNKKLWIVLIISYIIISIFPFEKIMQFNTVDKIFKYYHPNSRIIKKIEYDNYAYIYYSEKGESNFVYYLKNNNNWFMDNQFFRGQGVMKKYGYCTVFINKIRGQNITAFAIDCLNSDNTINDSLDTVFQKINNNEYSYIYMAVINKKLDDKYILNINGEEYHPFK